MALSRLGNRTRPGDFTWPGFVDALASLLMVFVFVLMVFVLIQANLAYRLSGQDASLSELRRELSMLGELLSLERDASLQLSSDLSRTQNQLAATQTELAETQRKLDGTIAQLAQTRTQLDAQTVRNTSLSDEVNSLSSQLGLSQSKNETLEDKLNEQEQEKARLLADIAAARAAFEAEKNVLQEQLSLSAEELESALAEIEGQRLALASLQTEIDEKQQILDTNLQQLERQKNLSADAKREIDELTLAMSGLQGELNRLRSLLDEKRREAVKDKIAIANLGKELNNALANKVQELQRFRSEFFGRLRQVLENRSDVQVVGDRFIFQSEVLFAAGQASIAEQGKQQLSQIAAALVEITATIPEDIPWILQVDGHTDDIPISGVYADNWDLSTERALSVVRFMAAQGVPPQRLAAAGYGEFQPVTREDTDAARQQNRRIELKLTQRIKVE